MPNNTTIDSRIDALLDELLSTPEGALTPVRRQLADLAWIIRDLVYGHAENTPASPRQLMQRAQIEEAIIEKIAAWVEHEGRDANDANERKFVTLAMAIRKGA